MTYRKREFITVLRYIETILRAVGVEGFGRRLKEERERIGLSQAKFAEACGVGKTAQYMYERGAREPDFSYMNAAEKLGVDALYVRTGTKSGDDWAYARAYKRMLLSIEMHLGLDEGPLDEIARVAVRLERDLDAGGQFVDYEPYHDAMTAWLKSSKNPELCFDLDLFARSLAELESAAIIKGICIPAEKKARVSVLLYRAFKATGRLDQKLIDDALRVAL